MAEQCWKCGTPLQVGAGIGAYCPNPACDVVDAVAQADAWEVRIRLDPPPPAAQHQPGGPVAVPGKELVASA
ncbi:hypothetical protein [Roseomonas sp. AR75]|uniref:hypothetical protein n=1 Tax=Roseomonas sp. AR75 TaxID=2562311 RepID=UPI0010BFE3D6|nr:hypothetical protein [Roseomonas sp. AR75]